MFVYTFLMHYIYIYIYIYIYVCVCVWERERESVHEWNNQSCNCTKGNWFLIEKCYVKKFELKIKIYIYKLFIIMDCSFLNRQIEDEVNEAQSCTDDLTEKFKVSRNFLIVLI